MKLASLCILAAASVLSLASMAMAADRPTYTAAQAAQPITIDGKLDSQWDAAAKVALSPTDAVVTEFGTVWDTVAAAGSFKVMWDSKYSYWAFDITDPVINVDADDSAFWQRDCVSGFIFDADREVNLKFFTSPKDKPYTCTGVLGGGAEANDEVKTGYAVSKTGYTVEVAIPWSLVNNAVPKVGDEYRFTTLVIDKSDAWGQYMWVGDGDNGDNFAYLKFGK